MLRNQGVLDIIIERLGLGSPIETINDCLSPKIEHWERLVKW